jgi:isopentenyl-diphosphate Delta-isomerase
MALNNKRQPESARQVEKRKVEHLKIQLEKDPEYQHVTTLFEDVFLMHNALPEIDRNDVDTSLTFLGKKLKAPYMVSAITGGAKQAAEINRNNAKACQELGLAMGFGSMKAMIVEPSLTYSYQVRDVAPDILLVGNIGANDLAVFPPSVLKETMKKTGVDFLAVHLNPAQELVQKEGEARFKGVLETIKRYSEELPIYVKECGQGLSEAVVRKLSTTNIQAIDVGGAGGTSWIGIEYLRRGQETGPLWDWGIPTALSVLEARSATRLPIIATGGIRSGEDVVKALVLGATIGSAALPSLRKGNDSFEASLEHLSSLVREIGDVMFLVGAKDVKDLAGIKPRIVGRLKELTTS